MKTHWKRLLVTLAAATWVSAQAGVALGQQGQPRKPPVREPPRAQPAGQNYYDMYEPNLRQRLRRETCGRDELPDGANCVRMCKKGYIQITGSNPPRCRSIAPLPAGQLPGPVRKETGTPPQPPRMPVPPPAQPGKGPHPV